MLADYQKPDMHKHLCSHLAFAPRGRVSCETAYGKIEADGVFIGSDVMHTIGSDGEPIVLFLFDENGAAGREVKRRYLGDKPVVEADKSLIAELRRIFAGLSADSVEDESVAHSGIHASDAVSEALDMLLGGDSRMCGRAGENGVDARIQGIIDYLEGIEEIDGATVDELAARACLSKSRLSHLFTENVGVSLHRYLSFMKMKKANTYILQGMSMTDAALRAGFDSSSHFSSTMRRMFGISLTDVKRSMKTASN